MRIILLWRDLKGAKQDPLQVASRLQRIFQPLFHQTLGPTVVQRSELSLIFLQLPVKGWRAPFAEEDPGAAAFTTDYPVQAEAVLRERGINTTARPLLPLFARELQRDPASVLLKTAPPFCVVWNSKQCEETYVQNDALGQSQLFEFQDATLWALTNRITALKALGVSLRPVAEDWAVRFTCGWFPLDLTGYEHLRFVEPGIQIRVTPQGIARRSSAVLNDWLHPEARSVEECLELARDSLLHQIEAAVPNWEKPTVGLSGGWDSRAVASSLRVLNAEFSARVRGLPGRNDVLIAQDLARIAGFPLKHKSSGGLPPEDPKDCKRSLRLALLWQAGHMVGRKHKSFLSRGTFLDGGVVNVMGQHGEIGRGYYSKKIGPIRNPGVPPARHPSSHTDEYGRRLVDILMRRMPPFTRQKYHDVVHETVLAAFRQAAQYDLEGLLSLDFFYLFERTRRWASASLSAQSGFVFAPFLNPDYIRAVFAYPGSDKERNPFHRYIIAKNSPEWADVPYSEDVESAMPTLSSDSWKKADTHQNYDSTQYWSTAGRPLLEEALRSDGFWTEIFDPKQARIGWQTAPDELVIAHFLNEFVAEEQTDAVIG